MRPCVGQVVADSRARIVPQSVPEATLLAPNWAPNDIPNGPQGGCIMMQPSVGHVVADSSARIVSQSVPEAYFVPHSTLLGRPNGTHLAPK